MTIAVIIVAAGRGTRASGTSVPKQYVPFSGAAVLTHTLRAFDRHPAIDRIVAVIHDSDRALYASAVAEFGPRLRPPVLGGSSRQESVRKGLEALATETPESPTPDLVLIHDGARPFVDAATISRVIAALATHAGAIAALPVTDTLKRAKENGSIAATIDRAGLWRAQTPQGFLFTAILDAHRQATAECDEAVSDAITDDAALAEWAGLDVALVPGATANIKLTTPEDLAMAARWMALSADQEMTTLASVFETRTASGFDVHKFAAGDHVWLCGVKISHDFRLDGHSDADVGLHALTDAILGALAEGDIGAHFPPSDPQWKGAPSHLFLADAARRVLLRGGRIVNVDVTLLCESPRITPHRDAMRAAMAKVLGIEVSRVAVKATTTETLGFLGRREGIAALATATLRLPSVTTCGE